MTIRPYLLTLKHDSAHFRWPIMGSAFLGIVQVVTSLLFIAITVRLVNLATGVEPGGVAKMGGGAVALCLCAVVQLGCSLASRRISVMSQIKLCNNMRERYFAHVMQSQFQCGERMHTADMLNRIEFDTQNLSSLLCQTVPDTVVTLFRFVGALIFLCILDWHLALILVFIMPFAMLASKTFMRRTRQMTRDIRDNDSRVQTHLQEHLQHRTLISTLGATTTSLLGLGMLQDELYGRLRLRNDYSVVARGVVQLGFSAGFVAAFLWGVWGLAHGTVNYGMLTAFLQLVGQIQRPVVELGNEAPAFINGMVAAERLADIEKMGLEETGDDKVLKAPVGVKFHNVTFAYPGEKTPVFKAFSHDFTPGSLTAVTGETGAGKTTLLRLLLGLVKPDNGSVEFYDSHQTADASPMTRSNVIYVPQGNTLLNGTIRANLLMAKPDATDQEMCQALALAMAQFVFSLPRGLDTNIGELGAGLSEGQAQRIAIARGLLRPGAVMVLDEPTSALDGETESQLMKNLATLSSDKTLIIVTHREAVTRVCTSTLHIGV